MKNNQFYVHRLFIKLQKITNQWSAPNMVGNHLSLTASSLNGPYIVGHNTFIYITIRNVDGSLLFDKYMDFPILIFTSAVPPLYIV